MITVKDLQEAIAECQGERNPNAQTCIKLAAYYTIMDHLDEPATGSYSFQAAPSPPQAGAGAVSYDGESDFAMAVDGQDWDRIWPILDEMMTTIEALHPRLYESIMRRIGG